jgi:aminopeptidase
MPLFDEIRKLVIKKGAYPHEHIIYDSQLGRAGMDYDWLKYASEEQLKNISEAKKKELEEIDVYINIGGRKNTRDLNDIDSRKISLRKKETKVLADMRREMRWVLATYPTNSLAQKAEMSTKEFQDFVINAANIDWERLEEKNEKIKERMDKAEEVRIKSKNTDLRFSLKNREGVPTKGRRNLPDGEVFYAPVKDSMNGEIEFTYPGRKQGNEVKNISLTIEDGKVVEFSADQNEEFLREQLNTDDGSKFIGEFGIGTNWEIDRFTNEMALDEKINGTVHFALGSGFKECMPDGEEPNESAIHWDIVKDLRIPEGDGGKIIADGEVVQEDGEWKIEGL